MDKTLWKDPEKKFKPRNKQAALVTIKAKPIFLPPEEIPPPVMAETFLQRIARENIERAKRVAEIRASPEHVAWQEQEARNLRRHEAKRTARRPPKRQSRR